MPLGGNDGAARRVVPVKGPEPKFRNEFCPQVSVPTDNPVRRDGL